MLMVSWTEPASEKSIALYHVDYRSASATKWMEKPINVTALNYTIEGVINETVYLVRVRAVDGAGNMGNWSDNGSATPMAMPIAEASGAYAGASALRCLRPRCGPAGGWSGADAASGAAPWPPRTAADDPLKVVVSAALARPVSRPPGGGTGRALFLVVLAVPVAVNGSYV